MVLITGAASGMGRAAAHLFADEGAKVALVDRTGAALATVAGELEGAGHGSGSFVVCPADVTDASAVRSAVDSARDALGPIDILINNAGVSVPAGLHDDRYEEAWDTTLAVNLAAHTHLVRACLDDLRRNGEGRVVNVASTEGLGATPGLSAYTASKHGVIGLTRSLAVELGRSGVTVNCVAPGPIHTGMTAGIDDADKQRFARRNVPVGRYGQPEEVAHAMLSLALPAASYINGALLVVDGGMTVQNV